MTLFTQGAAGSRHTSWPVFLSVALCKSKRQRCLQNMHHWIVPNKVVPSLKGQISVRTRGEKKKCLHDLGLLTVRVGGDQLHLFDVAADGSALRLDAAAVQLNSQTS